jgi:phosphatidylinositol alpha-mannosyltransferase
MKVAVVSPYGLDMPGGVQQQVIELVTWLNRNGHDATVVGPNAERPGVDLGGTIRWHANGAVAPINLSPMQFVRLRRTLSDFDVVHVHEPFMPTIGWAALRGSTPKAATFHADPSTLVRTIYGGLRRTLGRSVALGAVSAVSLTAATVVSEWDPVLIPNGLDVGSYRLDVARTQRQVAFLGRPDHRKGRDIPAFVDLLDGTGLHFANEDVRRLADRLIEVVADVTKQQALAAASTERIGQFDWDVVGEAYVDLYRRAQSV